jgi:lipoprotein-releasing system ATP-binding protein
MGVRVEVDALHRSFVKGGQRIDVLRGADLVIEPGGSVAVVGQSGCGKSTFMHLLGGLEAPTAGEVRVDGSRLHDRPRAEMDAYRNRTVGFVFQFHHLLPDHDALDNAAMPCFVARVDAAQARASARAGLARVGLAERLHHRPGELSGGEQQRVAIARALVMRPGLLLCDEPTGNLDPATAAEVLALLLELNREAGTTLVVVTHSEELAARLQRRVRLRDGRFEEMAA